MRGKDFRRHHDRRIKDRARDVVLNAWQKDPTKPSTMVMAIKQADSLCPPKEIIESRLPAERKPATIRSVIAEEEFKREIQL